MITRLLTTVSRTLSTSPLGASSPAFSSFSKTFSWASISQARWLCTGLMSCAASLWSRTALGSSTSTRVNSSCGMLNFTS